MNILQFQHIANSIYNLRTLRARFRIFKFKAVYRFLSNAMIFIEHDDNFDKSLLKFLASIR